MAAVRASDHQSQSSLSISAEAAERFGAHRHNCTASWGCLDEPVLTVSRCGQSVWLHNVCFDGESQILTQILIQLNEDTLAEDCSASPVCVHDTQESDTLLALQPEPAHDDVAELALEVHTKRKSESVATKALN